MAELSGITQLPQPRVSTHLARLKETGLVSDRRDGVFVYYRIASAIADPGLEELWRLLRQNTDDPLIQQDLERIAQILTSRAGGGTWADSVAGDMERHYSPGRTWEATARGLVHLLEPGDVLDIASGDGALAELLAPTARSIVCLDISERGRGRPAPPQDLPQRQLRSRRHACAADGRPNQSVEVKQERPDEYVLDLRPVDE